MADPQKDVKTDATSQADGSESTAATGARLDPSKPTSPSNASAGSSGSGPHDISGGRSGKADSGVKSGG
jgi:hypothetical protein